MTVLGERVVQKRRIEMLNKNRDALLFNILCSEDTDGWKQKLKTDKLERLELILRGCVGKCAKNGDRIVLLQLLLLLI